MMSKFTLSPEYENRPNIQMAPLIDIVFLTLIFFMSLSIFSQMETELNISVPKADASREAMRSPGEIIININKDGNIIVNQKHLGINELQDVLNRISGLFPNQAVIIRADEKTFHQHVIKVLDACAAANIWNVAFSTIKGQKE